MPGRWTEETTLALKLASTRGSRITATQSGRQCSWASTACASGTPATAGGARMAARFPWCQSTKDAEANLETLPLPVLQRWFPALVKGTHAVSPAGGAGGTNSTRSSSSSTRQDGSFLVYPAPLTDAWVSMHRFDQQKVAQTMEEAREFVDALNRAGYKSPY
ncbi:hypothetical protein GGH92_007394 [Coemansia sp. RSA 2673]|nr:hypothetical protein GGH92_007394 [Coemansia sp. RSA 2673]